MFLKSLSSQTVQKSFSFIRMLFLLVLLGLFSASLSQAQGNQADPSYQLVRGVPDTCSADAGEEFRFEALVNASFGSGSNQGTLSVEGIGEVASFAANHNEPNDYPIFGDGFYDFVVGQAYEVPAGTTITAEITTYTGLNQIGQLVYRSTLSYTCDLGETVDLSNQVLLDEAVAQPGFVFDLPSVDPAFELTQGVPDMCSAETGEEFRFDTFNNVSFGSGSNQATLSVVGVGQVAAFAGNHNQVDDYPSIGNGFYDMVIEQAYDAAAGTTITLVITTYTGLNQTGQPAYRSTLSFDCDLALNNNVTNEVLLGTAVEPDQTDTTGAVPPVEPAFALTTGIPSTCAATIGDNLRFDTLNNIAFGNTSNSAALTVPGVGVVAAAANNHDQPEVYPSVGTGFFDLVIDTAYDLPANTTITVEIITYDALNQTGEVVYRSLLRYDCSTGEVISLDNENLLEQAG